MANPLLSIIVPVFNEEESVGIFIDTVNRILDAEDIEFEFIFVNDGSTDNTKSRLQELAGKDSCIRIVNLSRNFGKEAALTAGIDHARGDIMVPIDVDLQDPPEIIPRLIERWREGYDVVYGLRASRKNDAWGKRATAGLFYRLFNRFSPIHMPNNVGDFRLFDRRVAEVLRRLPERNRFMKGLFAWAGFRSIDVPYERNSRRSGVTKWNYWRLWNFALDGIVGFTTVPLRVWSYLGFIVAMFSFLYGIFLITRTLMLGIDVPGYASIMTVILFLGGMQLLSIGILGEYLGRIMVEVKGRPIYVVESLYPKEPQGSAGKSGD